MTLAEPTTFAPDYPRDDNNWVKFPTDTTERNRVMVGWRDAGLEADHPAKANYWLIQEIIKHTTVPGQTIMDVTAGSGTLLQALAMGRNVITIDIAEVFVEWMKLTRDKVLRSVHDTSDQYALDRVLPNALILHGNCEQLLPVPADSIIFSPPYAGALATEGGIKSKKGMMDSYNQEKGNLGQLSNFHYNRAMARIYKLCAESLPQGGLFTIIIKDRIDHGRRINLAVEQLRNLTEAGFEPWSWNRWLTPGHIFSKIHESHGVEIIKDEHVITVRKV